MDFQIPDKSKIENDVPFGSFMVSFQNVTDFWLEDNHPQLLSEYIAKIRDQLFNENHLFAPHLLRLVIVTSNISEVANYWGDQLGKGGETTQHELVSVVGKMFLWGDGEVETTYALIILREDIAASVFVEDDTYQEIAKSILAHELAHIDTNFMHNRLFDKSPKDSWTSFYRPFAYSIWSEFHAELTAHEFANYFDGDNTTEMFTQMLATFIDEINNQIKSYRISAELDKLTQFVAHRLEMLIAQIGRCLGSLHADSKGEFNVEWFFNEMGKVSLKWEDTSRKVYPLLVSGILSEEDYDNLGVIIMEYYSCMGLIPELLSDNTIYIHVPFTDTTMPNE